MQSLDDALAVCYNRLDVFGKTLMPENFSTPYSELHEQIFEVLRSKHQKIAIAAPRNLGKTTIARALAVHSVLYREYEFILYVSQSEGLAVMQTENIKRELMTNPDIRHLFGSIRVEDVPGDVDESFSKHSWLAFGNTLVMPRGSGQQVRGLLFKNTRPQLIIVDDLEDRSELENPENRRKNKEWFHSDLLRCIDRYSNKWRILYIDTLKHYESLLQELLNDPTWYGLRLELFTDDYKSLAPHLFSDEEVAREVENARANGTLDILYMELRSLPVSREMQSFRPEYFKYFEPTEIDRKLLEFVVLVDPAKTAQIHSADSAIVGLGINYATSAIYVWEVISGKMYPDEIYNHMFDMAQRLHAHVIGIEVTGLEEFIKQPVMNEMQRRGPQAACELVWLKARGGDPGGEKGKLKRIGALVPYYRQGYIWHNKSCCAKLESQLLAFPRSGLVDVADATAYVIELLELGGRYFTEPSSQSDDEDFDTEAEFRALYEDTEEALVYSRRI